MEKSKVYFTDFHTRLGEGLPTKLKRLMKKAGIDQIDMDGKFVAIKMHFGELGNLGFLRPNYAKAVADVVKELGGKPFLTDCNTLYPGSRKNALEHLYCAWENGFTPMTVGCPILIGDGLKGTDDIAVPVNGGEYIKEAYIGRAVMDADVIISLTHFKGHEATGFGGCLKNIGMGCGSRAGKMEMHSSGKPHVEQDVCIGCGSCQKDCAHSAITITDRKASIDHSKCVGCGRCIGRCPVDAVQPASDEANDVLNYKIAEYTWAVVKDKPCFHISLITDVSPNCDCHSENDRPIIPDVGMLASFDPVALDMACADLCLAQPIIPNSIPGEKAAHGEDCEHSHDPFTYTHPDTNWRSGIEHAVKLGLGSKEYELITVK